jgi:GT2 family glycosyltransferase
MTLNSNTATMQEPPPIPYICVLTLLRLDLLKRFIDSIDYPVNRVVILFQGNIDKNKVKFNNQFVKKFILISSNMNIGVSRGWNYFVKNFPSSYWLISGDDCHFEPNTLEHIANFMSIPSSLENVFCGLKIKNRNEAPAGFNTFVITKLLLQNVGLFDENIYPAYYEDNDLWHRIELTNQKVTTIDNAYINSGDSKHTGSCTLNSVHPTYRKKMNECYRLNENYYKTKWNVGEKNAFSCPFSNPKFSIKNHRIPHINYFKNQKILLGHTNAPVFTYLSTI